MRQNTALAIELMENVVHHPSLENQTELLQNALLNLGRAYWDTFPHNKVKAEEYWLRAADDGNGLVDAMTELGKFYAHTDTKNIKQSFYWHQNAAGNGSAYSQAALGTMYYLGEVSIIFFVFKNNGNCFNL